LREGDAALYLLNRLLGTAGARQGDTERVVGLRARRCDLASALGITRRRLRRGDGRQRALDPGDGTGVVTGAKGEPAHLLQELRPFDLVASLPEKIEPVHEAGAGAFALACFPMQTADLAVEPRLAETIDDGLAFPLHRLVMRERIGASAGQRQDI